MFKTNRMPRIPLQKRDSQTANASINRADIFKLISDIPKYSNHFLPFNNYKDNLEFASGLLEFCKLKFPTELKNIFFTEKDGLENLIHRLSEIICNKDIPIRYYDAENIYFIGEEESNYQWYFYLIEGKHYHEIKSVELRTAFFKLLKKYSSVTEKSFLNHTFVNGSDSHFEEIAEMSEMNFEDEIDNKAEEDFNSYFGKLTEPIKDCLVEYNIHIHLDQTGEIFNNYKPKNKFEKELKELLKIGLEELDFSVIHKFTDNILISYEDDNEPAFPFSKSYMLFYDHTNPFEEEIINMINIDLQNTEVTYPAKYYKYSNGKISLGTTEEDSKMLKKVCNYLITLNDLFDI